MLPREKGERTSSNDHHRKGQLLLTYGRERALHFLSATESRNVSFDPSLQPYLYNFMAALSVVDLHGTKLWTKIGFAFMFVERSRERNKTSFVMLGLPRSGQWTRGKDASPYSLFVGGCSGLVSLSFMGRTTREWKGRLLPFLHGRILL